MHINIAHLCSCRIEMGMSQHCSRLPKLTEPIGTQLFSSPTSPPQCFTKNSGRNWKWHFNSPREFTRPSWCCCQPKVTFSSRTAVRTWWVPQHSYDGLEANHKVSPMGRCQNPQDSTIFSNSRPFVLTFRTAGKSTSKKRSENHGFQWRWRNASESTLLQPTPLESRLHCLHWHPRLLIHKSLALTNLLIEFHRTSEVSKPQNPSKPPFSGWNFQGAASSCEKLGRRMGSQ